MIHLHEATKSFGRTRAVDRITFELAPGGITALLGPNGAGKTTTIRLIAGYLTPDAGRITLAGHDLAADPLAARRALGYLPESAPLYPEMTPAQYLDYRARLFNLGRTDRRHAVTAVLDRCRIREVASRRIGVLSKGYRQRVGLAAALVHNPPVLILDEPTNGLDPSQIRATRDLIRELAADRTVLLCTHLIAEAERTCERVLVIARGRLLADGPPAAVGNAGARTEMVCEGPADQPLLDALRAHLGASHPHPRADGPGWVRLEAGPGDADPLGRAARDAGRAVRRLVRVDASLEDRVVRLIESAEEHP